jgi:hypothetical protein
MCGRTTPPFRETTGSWTVWVSVIGILSPAASLGAAQRKTAYRASIFLVAARGRCYKAVVLTTADEYRIYIYA